MELGPRNQKNPALVTPEGSDPTKLPMEHPYAIIINPSLLKKLEESLGVYAATSQVPHQLSNSTLLNNYGALYIVNRKELLLPGSFVANRQGRFIKAGAGHFPILRYRSRIFKNYLNG